jgi:uncharacterized DUF497 family protein
LPPIAETLATVLNVILGIGWAIFIAYSSVVKYSVEKREMHDYREKEILRRQYEVEHERLKRSAKTAFDRDDNVVTAILAADAQRLTAEQLAEHQRIDHENSLADAEMIARATIDKDSENDRTAPKNVPRGATKKQEFEWDENKNRLNIERHHISFMVATNAFYDPHRVVILDEKHSQNEERFFCFGNDGKDILTVRFTVRGETIRIFGAGYWRRGKELYAQRNRLH